MHIQFFDLLCAIVPVAAAIWNSNSGECVCNWLDTACTTVTMGVVDGCQQWAAGQCCEWLAPAISLLLITRTC